MPPKYCSETAAEAMTRLRPQVKLSLSIPLFDKPVTSGQIFEVSGASGSGKTLLLMDIAKECVMNKEYGGLESGVVFVACGKEFTLMTFVAILERAIKAKAGLVESGPVERAVVRCLSRFHYMAVSGSDEFTHGLTYLDRVFYSNPALARVLLIDDATSFCWLDIDDLSSKQSDHCRRLKRFQTEHNVVIFASSRIARDPTSRLYKSKVNGVLRVYWSKMATETIILVEDKPSNRFKASLKDQTVYFKIKDETIEYEQT